MSTGDLRIRRSTPQDGPALARLAQLDSRPRPVGDHLLLEEDGDLRAAVPVDGGPAIADPFHRTETLVAILELRAHGLRSEARGQRRRVGGSPLRRLRPPRAAAAYGRSPVPTA